MAFLRGICWVEVEVTGSCDERGEIGFERSHEILTIRGVSFTFQLGRLEGRIQI